MDKPATPMQLRKLIVSAALFNFSKIENEDDKPDENEDDEVVEETIEFDMPGTPEDLQAADFDATGTLEKAQTAFRAEFEKGADSDLNVVTALAADIKLLQGEVERRDELAAENKAKVDEIAKDLGLDDVEDKVEDDDKSDDDDADDDAKGKSDDENEDEDDDEKSGDDDVEDKVEDDDAKDKDDEKSMAAGGTRKYTRVKPRRRPRTDHMGHQGEDHGDDSGSTGPSWSLVAGANGGLTSLERGELMKGDVINVEGIGEIARDANNKLFGARSAGDKQYIAQYQFHAPENHTLTDENAKEFSAGLDEFRPAPKASDFEEDGSLTAGAACGIWERDFSLYSDWKVGKLLSLDTRVLSRGALEMWEPGTDLCEIIDQLADNVACDTETVKVEVELACPTPMEVCETCARYLITKRDNFRAQSDAGEYEHEFRKHLAAHMINKHLDHLHKILTDPTTEVRDLSGSAAFPLSVDRDMWYQLSVQACGIRTEYCLPDDYALEAIVPCTVPKFLLAAVAREHGCATNDVTEAMIRRCFALHLGATVQFVDWWQRLDPAADEFPSWVDILLMPAGTWFEGTQGTLNLGNEIRDSQNNSVNCYTTFTEDFYTTCRRKYGSRLVRINNCITGAGPERVLVPCSTVPGVDSTIRPAFAGK